MTMTTETDAPGLLKAKRKGRTDYYWSASRASKVKAAEKFTPRTVNITRLDDEARAKKCRDMTAELTEWLRVGGELRVPAFDGTIKSLNLIYEKHPDSPYHDVEHATQIDYDAGSKIMVNAIGGRRIDRIDGANLRRWHKKFKKPAVKGGPERLRRAQGAMKALRRITSWGVKLRLPGCVELRLILHESRFTMPPAREHAPTFEQIVAYIEQAHVIGRPSLAMAAALQYDCTMRLYDVIGQWKPEKQSARQGGYYDTGKRWSGGILWSEIKDGILVKKATKNGAKMQFRVADCPLLSREIERVPVERRIGPMVIDEVTGRPFRIRWFNVLYWRVKTAAGIPAHIWARDTRAGAITEAFDAGAETEQVRQTAGHSDPKVTGRYNRGSTRQTSNVSALRIALRDKEQK